MHLYPPQVLAMEISCTGAMFPGPLALEVPGQHLHQVIRGANAALALNGLGQADGEEQDWANRDSDSDAQTEQHMLLLYVLLYLCGKHSRGPGCSRSAADMWCQVRLPLHFDCTDPTRTAVRRSTPRPWCRAVRQKPTLHLSRK